MNSCYGQDVLTVTRVVRIGNKRYRELFIYILHVFKTAKPRVVSLADVSAGRTRRSAGAVFVCLTILLSVRCVSSTVQFWPFIQRFHALKHVQHIYAANQN